MSHPPAVVDSPFYVVGIGASAGGLEALERFFQPLPANSGLAFVIIQHLSPDYKSMMAEILSKFTTMPVREAADRVRVEPNHVYLIPPKKNMAINGGCLSLSEKGVQRGLSLPIDTFFHSLALDQRERAIGVVLSGTGSDGSRGIRSIKESDGMVVVQRANTAKFDGMPASAINTGLADFILPPEEIGEALINVVRHPGIDWQQLDQEGRDPAQGRDGGSEIHRILDLIKEHAEVDFHQYKPSTILRRVERRAGIRQCRDVAEYLTLLQGSDAEKETFFHELLIGVTKFFRDPETFAALQQQVIPQIFAARRDEESVRVWVAGCSTGEEAYTLAMLCAEYKVKHQDSREVKIFATDIDQHALGIAAAGVYPEGIAADIEADLLARYFVRNDQEGHFTVIPRLRRMVVFARHDLTRSPPFNRLDLISCRNLFIYLRSEIQGRILGLFHFALRQPGFLLLGESESIGDYETVFTCIDRRHRLYQTRPGVAPQLGTMHEEVGRGRGAAPLLESSPPSVIPVSAGRGFSRQVGDYLQGLVVERLLPPCVLINDHLDALYISRQASRYLHIHGTPDFNLLRMLPESVAALVRSAVVNALKQNRTVIYKTFDGGGERGELPLEIVLEPLGKKHSGAQLLLLTMREEAVPQRSSEEVATIEVSADTRQHIEELERELAYTRETLQATIEELETSNEELQSTNEELLASNEELQATNEELQAVNEELITVNSEHQHKIQELVELNETHANLLRSSRVGSVFLDRQGSVRSFTPAVRDEIYLRESDVGRPFAEIRHTLQIAELSDLMQRALHDAQIRDREIRSESGRWYILRLAPYLLSDNRVDGVVLTLLDISERKQFEERLQASEERLQRAQQIAQLGSWELNHTAGELVWSEQVCRIFGLPSGTQQSLTYEAFLEMVHPEDRETVDRNYQDSLNSDLPGYELEHRIVRRDTGEVRHLLERCIHERDHAGRVVRSCGMVLDITERLQIQERIRMLSRAVEQSANAVLITDHEGKIEFVNPAFEKVSGYCAKEIVGQTPRLLKSGCHPPEFYQEIWRQLLDRGHWQGEIANRHKNGSLYWDSVNMSAVRNERGEVTHYLSIQENITLRKQAEEALRQAKLESEQAYRTKSHFLANMSYELRTPLHSIMAYSWMLEQHPALPSEQRDAMVVIHRSADHLLKMINQVLDISELESGGLRLRVGEWKVADYLQELQQEYYQRCADHGLSFRFRCSALPERIEADGERVQQILEILFDNALKLTTQGGIELVIHAHPLELQRLTLEFLVSDSGPGISPLDMGHLLDPFYKAHNEFRREGFGLGLPLCQALVLRMGGELALISKTPGGEWNQLGTPLLPPPQQAQGTQVRVAIPVTTEAATPWREEFVGGAHEPIPSRNQPVPPLSQLSHLIDLCQVGDVEALIEYANTLEDSYPAFNRWALQLIESLRLDQLATLLQQYEEGSNHAGDR